MVNEDICNCLTGIVVTTELGAPGKRKPALRKLIIVQISLTSPRATWLGQFVTSLHEAVMLYQYPSQTDVINDSYTH